MASLLPDLGVTKWIDASGRELVDFGLSKMDKRFRILFCFQDACPGCHSTGFPALISLVERLRSNKHVAFAAVQTVFEEFELNTLERGFANQLRYALPIPFGHDDGGGHGSVLMKRYANGGTPWFIVIEGDRVISSGFRINVDALINHVELSIKKPSGALDWQKVLALSRENARPRRRVEKTPEEWRALLTAEQFRVARAKGTERAHSSSMCTLFAPGRYNCVCCETPLFDAAKKFDSGTGWPSFTEPIDSGVVAYHQDETHGMRRVEVTCAVCDAHLGHVFPDGPAAGGLRFCINAVSLKKEEAPAK